MDEPFFDLSNLDAEKEIGENGIRELKELQQWLYGEEQPLNFRLAPSIVTRGEAELLNQSLPRFAVRVYLDADRTAFANARRIEVYADRAKPFAVRRANGKAWKHYQAGLEEYEWVQTEETPEKIILKGGHCLADCLLTPTDHRTTGYAVLKANLGWAYGEGKSIDGTPFVNHIRFMGGGLCAQAACFMANALLHDIPCCRSGCEYSGIHSVAEVTAIVQGNATNELFLKGMTWAEIVDYFYKIGRAATHQRYFLRPYEGADHELLFGKCLRAYAISGMPVILPINSANMYERTLLTEVDGGSIRGIYEVACPDKIVGWRNHIARKKNEKRDLDHAVLLVGCHREEPNRFLINDPARRPFVPATSAQLYYSALDLEKRGGRGQCECAEKSGSSIYSGDAG